MQAAQERTAGYFLYDVSNGCVRVIGRRRVIKREKDSGDGLRDKKKEQDRAEDVGPARAAWDWLIQRFIHQRSHSGANVEPAIDALSAIQVRFVRFPVGHRRVSHWHSF